MPWSSVAADPHAGPAAQAWLDCLCSALGSVVALAQPPLARPQEESMGAGDVGCGGTDGQEEEEEEGLGPDVQVGMEWTMASSVSFCLLQCIVVGT